MRHSVEGIKRQRGSVLVMTSIFSFAVFLVGLSYLTVVHGVVDEVQRTLEITRGKYAAMSAEKAAREYLNHHNPSTDHRLGRVHYYDNVYYDALISYGGQSSDDGFSYNTNYVIEGYGYSSTYTGGQRDFKIRSGSKQETFADYLYLTDQETDMVWGNTIYFWSPDTLDGKVHSNDHISIMSWADHPVFKKRVSSSANYINPPNNHAEFWEGLYLNAAEIYFPDQAQEVRNYAAGQYTYGSGTTDSVFWLAFLGNGYKLRKSSNRGLTWDDTFDNLPLNPLPASGAIFVRGKCWISTTAHPDDYNSNDGGLDGRVTVGSSDTMYVRGKTVYSCWDPVNRIVPLDCDDALGLISEKWVLVSNRLPYGHYGITINAAIAALRGSFSVDRIYNGDAGEHQSLLVYGSLAQFHRGIVHTGSCGWGNGYCQKDYKYDDRFRRNPPPHFIPINDSAPVYYEPF